VICALTVRHLNPGSFDEFREAFLSGMDPESPPEGWVRFTMLRGAEDPDEVVTFGHFDGTVDELRRNAEEMGYADQQARIAPYVASVGTDGLFEVVVEYDAAAPAG
jgi:heme-degrading monooxygenase HmoA